MTLKKLLSRYTVRERRALYACLALLTIGATATGIFLFNERTVRVPIAGGSYREGLVGQPITINPVFSANPVDEDISMLLYANLGTLSAHIEPKKDGLTYAIKLKENLKWSDGAPLSAEDVVFTVESLAVRRDPSPKTAWTGARAMRESELEATVSLPMPSADFAQRLESLLVIPAHTLRAIPPENIRLSRYNLEPVGSGPYRVEGFAKRKDGFISEYRLVPNQNYAGPAPFIRRLALVFFETEDAAVQAFRLRRIDGFGTTNLLDARAARHLGTADTLPMTRFYALFFNLTRPEVQRTDVRRALRNAVDRRRIAEEALLGRTELLTMHAMRGTSPEPETESPAPEANASLDLPLLTLYTPRIPVLEKTASIVKQNWERAGVREVRVVALDPAELADTVMKTGEYDVLLFGNAPDMPGNLFPFLHSSHAEYPGLNLARYRNEAMDTLLERIRKAKGAIERAHLRETVDLKIESDVPFIVLYTLPYTYIHTPRLKGLEPSRLIAAPKERFMNITAWHLREARVLKK